MKKLLRLVAACALLCAASANPSAAEYGCGITGQEWCVDEPDCAYVCRMHSCDGIVSPQAWLACYNHCIDVIC